MQIKVKLFESDTQGPLPTPDGTSLEEKVNVFTATVPEKNILEIHTQAFSSAKYGTAKTYTATVVYKA